MSNLYRLDVYNTSGVKQYSIDDFLSLAYTRRVNHPGAIQFTISGDHGLISTIGDKWQVEVWRKPDGEDWAREITGLYRMGDWSYFDMPRMSLFCAGLMSMLGYSIVAWDAGIDGKSQFTSDPAETIMKNLVTVVRQHAGAVHIRR